VTVFDEENLIDAFSIAAALRRAGIAVACYPEAAKLPKQLKYADRIGARFVLIYGPDEKAAELVAIKDLVYRTQQTVAKNQLAGELQKLLA